MLQNLKITYKTLFSKDIYTFSSVLFISSIFNMTLNWSSLVLGDCIYCKCKTVIMNNERNPEMTELHFQIKVKLLFCGFMLTWVQC